MAGSLSGKTAIVTAAGQGIGRAAVLAFADAGADVLASDINPATLADLDGRSGISTRILDVLDRKAILRLAAEVAAPDILFNCAGHVHHGSVLDCTDEDWHFAIDLNVRSMFWTISAFLPGMLTRGSGCIINMSSVASSVRGLPNRFAYGTSKAAVIGLTKSVAMDFLKQGIRCNAICPGTIQTPSLDQRIAAFADPVKARQDFIARQPIGRLGTPEEIAGLCVFLAGDAASYMTGQVIAMDGGMTI